MEKHVGLNPAWFEPGPGGVSPFERISATVGFGAAGTAAAFRALIAQEQATDTPALQVGDVVRLEEPLDIDYNELLVGKEFIVQSISKTELVYFDQGPWPADRVTLIRRAGEPAPADKDAEIAELRESLERSRLALNTTRQQRDKFWSQRDAARAEVERLTARIAAMDAQGDRDMLLAEWNKAAAERDALQARIDACVRVWSIDGKDWSVIRCLSDNHSALLLDARPIAEADERKAERRVVVPKYITEDGSDYAMAHHTPWITNKRKSDRRRTAGTRADRGKAS